MTLHFAGLHFDTDYKPPFEDSVTGPLMRVDCGTAYSLRALCGKALTVAGWAFGMLLMAAGFVLAWWRLA
jgi:hypothetical protein